MMEERSTFETEEFGSSESKGSKETGKKRSLSDAAEDAPNLPPEESKEEELTPAEAQRRTDALIQKMLAEEGEEPDDDMDELDL